MSWFKWMGQLNVLSRILGYTTTSGKLRRGFECDGESMGDEWVNHAGEEVRKGIMEVLASRRKLSFPPWTISGIPTRRAYTFPFERDVCSFSPDSEQNLKACSKKAASDFEEEKIYLNTEECEQGRVPVLLIRPAEQKSEDNLTMKRPAVVFLHCTGKSKEAMRDSMESFAARGYVTVSIDSRYHGERAKSSDAYSKALIRAWATAEEMPFIFDTVWDLMKLVDYLQTRPDIDPARIGMLGISLGGMHAWYAAVADPRIRVVVPIIAVQCFGWAVINDMWHARVQSIPHVFEVAKEAMGKSAVDSEIVASVWRRTAPGLIDKFDAEHTIPAIAPRPLLILNGEEDQRCPVRGLAKTLAIAKEVYKTAGVAENFKFKAEEGVEHAISNSMLYDASVWIDKHLRPDILHNKSFNIPSKFGWSSPTFQLRQSVTYFRCIFRNFLAKLEIRSQGSI